MSSAVRSPRSRLYSRRAKLTMSWSISSPPMRMLRLTTIPPRLMTATSVVPPPMSTMREPVGSETGSPAPIAAAMGSSMRRAQRAPALSAASRTARFSTSVTPDGIPITIRGRGMSPIRSWTRCTKYLIICSVTSKSLMTPSRRGRMAMMFAGVRPTIRLASAPIARTFFVLASIATTLGSLITMPRSRTWTSVFAVPRSMPMSREKMLRSASNMVRAGCPSSGLLRGRVAAVAPSSRGRAAARATVPGRRGSIPRRRPAAVRRGPGGRRG